MSLVTVPLAELWLAILLAAVFVFIASSVIHMATKWHQPDHKPMPDEASALDALRGMPPGDYVFPGCTSMKEMGTPEMLEKYKQGPVGFITLLPPGPPAIGKALIQWFVFSLIVGLFTAYVCSLTLPAGADSMFVFRVSGTVAFMGYVLADMCNSIWKGVSWATTFRFLVDGLVYALCTAGTFAWLWPDLI